MTSKKLVSIFLCLMMLFTYVPATYANTGNSCGDNLTWSFNESSGVLVISGSGRMDWFNYQESPWYSIRESIKSVEFYGEISSLGSYAFQGLTALKEITIPQSVTEIGYDCFDECSSLTNITVLSTELQDVSGMAFVGCTSLESITISENCADYKSVDGVVYTKDGESIVVYPGGKINTEFVIPDNVKTICREAFIDNRYIQKLSIHKDVSTIEEHFAQYCYGLAYIDVDEESKYYTSVDNVLFTNDMKTLIYYAEGKSDVYYAIPDGVERVGDYCFFNTKVLDFDLPDSLCLIGEEAFRYGKWWYSNYNKDELLYIGNHLLYIPNSAGAVTVKDGTKSISAYAGAFKNKLTQVTLPSGLKYIANSAFYGASNLFSVNFPEGLIHIGESAFENTGLTSFDLPDSVEYLGDRVIRNTSIISNTDLWSGDVFYAGKFLISAKSSLSGRYSVKEGTAYILSEAFMSCSMVEAVTLPDSVKYIGNNPFPGISKFVNIPKNIISIGSGAYWAANEYLKDGNLDLPEGLTYIGEGAFKIGYGTETINRITLPASLKEVGDSAFERRNPKSIIIKSSDTKYGKNVFANNRDLKSVIFPDGTSRIEDNLFSGSKLTEVYIPESIEYIGKIDFDRYDPVIYYSGTQDSWDAVGIAEGENFDKISVCCDFRTQGSCGDSTMWSLDIATGELMIFGTGETDDYCEIGSSFSDPDYSTPWKGFSKIIKSAVITQGVTYVGESFFKKCKNLEKIYVPSSVSSFGGDCFSGCENLREVYVEDLESWLGTYFGRISYRIGSGWDESSYIYIYNSNPLELGAQLYVDYKLQDKLVIPGTVAIIGDSTFKGSTWIKEVVISNGVKSIGANAFEECTNLKEIVIPNSVESIGTSAFASCTNLKEIAIPNSIESIGISTFAKCTNLEHVQLPDNLTSIGMNAFTGCTNLKEIVIPSSVQSIGTSAFEDCIKLKIICYESSYAHDYAVNNNIPYELLVTTTFNLNVRSEGEDESITDGITIKWYKGEEIIGTGNSIIFFNDGQEFFYEIIIDESLAFTYKNPGKQKVDISGGENIDIELEKIKKVNVSGDVKNADNEAVVGAKIEFVQNVDKYTKKISVYTNSDGAYSADLLNVSTTANISAEGYYKRKIDVIDTEAQGNLTVNTAVLTSIPQNKITVSFTRTEACEYGAEPVVSAVSDVNGLEISVYNVTRNKNITDFVYQYPYIAIGSGVGANDVIHISVTDTNKEVTAEPVEVLLDENKMGKADINLVENGRIKADVLGTTKTLAFIFDEAGNVITKQIVTGASFTSAPLENGSYKAVFIKGSDYLKGITSISKLNKLGLRANIDYIQIGFESQNGRLKNIGEVKAPQFDETRLYYTDKSKTSVSSNYKSAILGKLVTIKAEYKMLPEYEASNQRVDFTIPEGMQLIKNSVMIDGKLGTYTTNGNILSVTTNQSQAVVRFYCVATKVGQYDISADISFDLGNENITQPLGSAGFEGTENKIKVPSVTVDKNITVTGTANANSIIKIYSGENLVGETRSNSSGSWKCSFDLQNTFNYSYHKVYATIENSKYEGLIVTPTKSVLYNPAALLVSKVTMYNMGDNGENITVFDFENPGNAGSYRMWPGVHTDFTFVIDFMGDASKATDVVLSVFTKSGEVRHFNALYDETKNAWIVKAQFTTYNEAPVNVNVDFKAPDLEEYEYSSINHEDAPAINTQFVETVDKIFDDITSYKVKDATDNSVTVEYKLADNSDAGWDMTVKGLDFADFNVSTLKDNGFRELSADNPAEPPVYLKAEMTSGKIKYTYVDPYYELAFEYSVDTDGIFDNGTADFQGINPLALSVNSDYEDMSDFDRAIKDILENFPVPGVSQLVAFDELSNLRRLNSNRAHRSIMSVYDIDLFEKCKYTGDYRLSISDRDEAERLRDKLIADVSSTKARIESELDAYQKKITNALKYDLITFGIGRGIKNLGKVVKNSDVLDKTLKASVGVGNKVIRAETTVANVVNGTTIAVYEGVTELGQYMESIEDFFESIDCTGSQYWIDINDSYDYFDFVAIAQTKRDIVSKYNSCKPEEEPDNGQGGEDNSGGSSDNNSDERDKNDEIDEGPDRDKTPILDPSGYVFEAVVSNRVKDVTATIFYLGDELDEFDEPTGRKVEYLWNAADFDQINPQVTDVTGAYAWDVPEGNWLVKFEKDGYCSTDTKNDPAANTDGYLPVPPPQLDVNVEIVSKAAPKVEAINVYNNEVQIVFSQYMQIDTVNTENVKVTSSGKTVSGTILPVNAEDDYKKENKYASVFKFVPDEPLSGSADVEIYNVKNYAGTSIEGKTSNAGTVEVKPESIAVSKNTNVNYNSGALLQVEILPKEAGANKKLTVKALTPGIAGVVNNTVVTDENGKANIMITGNLPGEGQIEISLDGTLIKTVAKVTVGNVVGNTDTCKKVTANVASGLSVARGTKITLLTATEGAEIYYTLDGTCPCEPENPARIKYTEPLTVNEDMFIIAYSVKQGFADSPTAGFVYTVTPGQGKAAAPVANIAGSAVASGTAISLSTATEGAKIYYTVDGSEPTVNSLLYTSPVIITSPVTIKAIAEKGGMALSDVMTEVYTIAAQGVTGGGGGGGVSSYTVTFSTNGAKNIPDQSVKRNETVTKPADPVKEGYNFDGWYTDKELTKLYDFGTKVSKNLTLYAKWIQKDSQVTEPDTIAAFADVKSDDWFYENVQYVVKNKLMNGVSDDKFAPDANLTRAMLVTVLYRNEGEPAVSKSIPFGDVNMDSWYADAVVWAKQLGIVNGVSETEFAPDKNITREQIATIMYRYALYKGYNVNAGENVNLLSYDDFYKISDFASDSMHYAVRSGLIAGRTLSTLNPLDNATRAETAAILQRFIVNNK